MNDGNDDPFKVLGQKYLCGKTTSIDSEDYWSSSWIYDRAAAESLDQRLNSICKTYLDGGHPPTVLIQILLKISFDFTFEAHAENRLRAVESIIAFLHDQIHKRTRHETDAPFDPDEIIKF